MQTLVDTITIGNSDLRVAPLGVGAWSWGDTMFWGYGKEYNKSDVTAAFHASLSAGMSLIDTAEMYGFGTSERIVGQLARSVEQPLVLASKFFPFPWRLSAGALGNALDDSLRRLGVEQLDLYQIHFPTPLISIPKLMDALADAVGEGKVRYVGVSNFSAQQMRQAHAELARRGVPLVSNQVEYSLLNRAPETNGVLDACRELGVTLIAYSPLAQGLLTGKYRPGVAPSGVRRFMRQFKEANLRALEPVIDLMREIGAAHDDRSPSQVALNWLIARHTLPIPGAKNARQATENAGALGWLLDEDEVARLDAATQGWMA